MEGSQLSKGRLKEAVKLYLEVLKRKKTNSQPEELISIINSLTDGYTRSEDSNIDGLIQPHHPFSNEMLMKETIQTCRDHIYWIDRYFSENGLKFLNDYMNKMTVKELKILSSIPFLLHEQPRRRDLGIERFTKLRESFKKFQEEMKYNYNINCELRVMRPRLRQNIHDRWILTEGDINFNIPSPDTVSSGHFSNIRTTREAPKFPAMWNDSLDLIKDWDLIQQIMMRIHGQNGIIDTNGVLVPA